jgi:hypothetical protein
LPSIPWCTTSCTARASCTGSAPAIFYGLGCYQPNGCADIIRSVSAKLDARQFNRSFPKVFPRFVQHAIWRYCARNYFDICNGNRIDDRQPCQNGYCRLYWRCDRKPLM